MTNTPDKSEMKAIERVERRLNSAWAKHGFMTLTVSDLRELLTLARASCRPADQVPELVPVAKADRELYKFILDAPYATCSRIDNMPDDAPELQQIARHRLDQAPDMVERVAEAICDSMHQHDPRWPELSEGVRDHWRTYARAAIAALQAVPASGEVGWQPIESAPKDGMPVLLGCFRENLDGSIYQEGGAPVVAAWIPTKKLADDGAEVNWVSLGERLRSSRSFSPTHWHPLPTPPTLKASGEE